MRIRGPGALARSEVRAKEKSEREATQEAGKQKQEKEQQPGG